MQSTISAAMCYVLLYFYKKYTTNTTAGQNWHLGKTDIFQKLKLIAIIDLEIDNYSFYWDYLLEWVKNKCLVIQVDFIETDYVHQF